MASAVFAGAGRYVCKGIWTLLLMAFFVSAAVPDSSAIEHEGTPSRSDAAASDQLSRSEPADQGIAALADLLKSKNVISAEEAARFKKQFAPRSAGGKAPAAASRWSERVRFGGDMRLRAEGDRPEKSSPGVPRPAAADQGIAALADLLKSKNVISAEEAARFKEQFAARAAGEKSAAVVLEAGEKEQIDKITANVTQEVMKDLPEQVRKQVREELREKDDAVASEKEQINELNQKVSHVTQKVAEMMFGGEVGKLSNAALPEWVRRLRLGGDVRLRYENDRFDKNNFKEFTRITQGTDTQTLRNTTVNADLFKYRVRFEVGAQANEQVDAVIRLSTGNTTTPVSTNALLSSYMNKDNVLFDLAYIKWQPWKFLTLYGGRMPNPWFSTDLVWARDLNFEGLALNLRQPITESWTPFLTAGAFPLQRSDPTGMFDLSQHNKWLFGGQVGLERHAKRDISAKLGAAYYKYSNITGVRNPDPLNAGATDWSAPLYQQIGNTLFYIDRTNSFRVGLASEFKELNITGALDIGFWDPVHIVLLGDYVENLGFKKSDVVQRTGNLNQAEGTTGYQTGMSVGYPAVEKFGQWNAFLYYKYLQENAVVDAFTDSDFHLGGTNAKGWVLGTNFALAKNSWLTLRWLTANEISGPPLRIDLLQMDFNVKF